MRLDFVVQAEPAGTADAVLAADAGRRVEPFLVLNADNLYPADVLRELAALDEPGLPVFDRDDLARSSNIPPGAVAVVRACRESTRHGYLTRIVEKPSLAEMLAAGRSRCWSA